MYFLPEYLKRLPAVLIAVFALMICAASTSRAQESPVLPAERQELTLSAAAEPKAVVLTTAVTTAATEETTTPATPAILERSSETKTNAAIDVPYISQSAYPTGCELVSTSMLLAFHGIDITAGELVSEGYIKAENLEKSDKDGELHGGDPNDSFIGKLDEGAGFGCYSGAIMKCLYRVLEDKPLAPTSLDGMSLEEICSRYIDNGYPVLIWGSIGMSATYDSGITWVIGDDGDFFTWRSNEHCLVLVGYDQNNYIFNDPLKWENTYYSKSLTEQRYEEMGKMAVSIVPFGEVNAE